MPQKKAIRFTMRWLTASGIAVFSLLTDRGLSSVFAAIGVADEVLVAFLLFFLGSKGKRFLPDEDSC